MKRKRGVPKALADNENAVVLVPELDKPEPEVEDPAVVEWNAFAQDHYELVEQLPLSLHRSYSLIRELDELAQHNTALIVPATRAYISLRDSLVHRPKHKRVPSGLDLLAHVSASVEPPSTPVPNLTTDVQESARDAVGGMLAEVPSTSADTSRSAAHPSNPDDQPSAPKDETNGQVEPKGETNGQVEPAAGPSTPPFPQDSRKLLTLIATLASDAVRASSEKLGIANAVYHTVDNHLTTLNSLIAQHKATLPPEPTPEPASPQPEEPEHEPLPPLRITRTPTTIRIRGKPKPKSVDEPPSRPRSASTAKSRSRSNKPPGKKKSGMDVDKEVFCTCRKESYGEMIACDGIDCPYEWFHYPCVNLTKAPDESIAWYCPDCASSGRKRRKKA